MDTIKRGSTVRCVNAIGTHASDYLVEGEVYEVAYVTGGGLFVGLEGVATPSEDKTPWSCNRFEMVDEDTDDSGKFNVQCMCEDKDSFVMCDSCGPKPFEVPTAGTTAYPDNNPKSAMGMTKAPIHLVPPAGIIGFAEALADGAAKYGAYNYRTAGIALTVYIDGLYRHILALLDGEDQAQDSLLHHMKHIGANAAIVLDCHANGMLIDDRPAPGKAAELLEAFRLKNTMKTYEEPKDGTI